LSDNILAVCSGGGIGDLLAATPAIKALHRRFGDPLTVLATPYAAPVLQDHPSIRDVMFDDGRESDRDLAQRLAERNFTHCVVFWSTARIAGAVRRAGIPVRVGQARRLYSWKYTTRVTVRTEDGDTTSHWTDVQMDYARALGAEPLPEDYVIEVHLRPEDIAQADTLRALHGILGRFAVLHAARGITLDRVRWPIENFAAIGDALGAAFDAAVVLTGSSGDAPTIEAIGRSMTAKHAVVAGQTSVMGLAALLSRAAPVVGLDSGPMHLASALGAPTVSIFALRTDLPDRWRPLGPRVAVVRPSYPCPPWHRKETCRTFDCYAHLSADVVVAAARAVVPHSASVDPAGTK
jgi:lipopolysaccharide heptosyltransferase I